MQSLVKGKTWQEVVMYEMRTMKPVISFEAVLLLLLRIMQALSKGEVVCDDSLKEHMVLQCVTAFTRSASAVQDHFLPDADSSSKLQLSDSRHKHAGVLDTLREEVQVAKKSHKERLGHQYGVGCEHIQLLGAPFRCW